MHKDRNNSPNPSRRGFLKAGVTAGLAIASGGNAAANQPGAPSSSRGYIVQPPSPAWAQYLIIYEIATKGFTSPNGPESGTFNSTKARLPYLAELGINGVWLTGHSLGDDHFFYNIWTQYANVNPAKIDPSLGTSEEFKALIAEAHRCGIRIFLDVHTHGILSYSPLIKEHPHWFRGGEWHMTDYNWEGGRTDLDDWWVKVWTNYVTEYGVDGFRLDFRIFRPDLWERIRQNAARAGHEIVLFEEDDAVIPGVTDFTQHDHIMRTNNHVPDSLNTAFVHNVASFYDRDFGKTGHYHVVIHFDDDGSRVEGSTDGQGPLRVRLDGLVGADKCGRRTNDFHADGIPDIRLTVENVASKPIENIFVEDDVGRRWQMTYQKYPGLTRLLVMEGKPPTIEIYLATMAPGWPLVQLSCHDEGWEGYPEDKSPYVAQGSRSVFGYSFLFLPMIPVFFAGEEFDANYRPIPWLSPHLWGGGKLGTGRWLYGNMLDWEELKKPKHAAMFEDVKKMIAVRKQEAGILALRPESQRPNLMAVPCEHDIPAPVPYIRWNHRAAIMVAGNLDTNRDAHLKLQVPLQTIGLEEHASYKVTRLWPEGESRSYTEKDLASFPCTVRRDKTPCGGLLVLKIQPGSPA